MDGCKMSKFFDELNSNIDIETHEFDGERYINLAEMINNIGKSVRKTSSELSDEQRDLIFEFIDYLESSL